MPLGITPDGWVIMYTYNFEDMPTYATNQTGGLLFFSTYQLAVEAVGSTLAGWVQTPPQYMWITPHYGMWIDGVRV